MSITAAPKADTSRSIRDDPIRQDQHRQILHAVFSDLGIDLNTLPLDLDAEVPLDEHRNTVLHWAAGLARVNLLRHFVHKGAAPERGKFTIHVTREIEAPIDVVWWKILDFVSYREWCVLIPLVSACVFIGGFAL